MTKDEVKKLLRNTLARFISLSNCAVNHIKILADALHAFVKVPADFLTRCGKRLAVGFLPRGKGAAPPRRRHSLPSHLQTGQPPPLWCKIHLQKECVIVQILR